MLSLSLSGGFTPSRHLRPSSGENMQSYNNVDERPYWIFCLNVVVVRHISSTKKSVKSLTFMLLRKITLKHAWPKSITNYLS